MLQTTTCVTVTCDQCRSGCDEDYEPHFPSPTDALQAVLGQGWEQLPDGRLLCQHCAARRRCESEGHDLGPWEPCLCRGRVTTDPTHPDGTCAAVLRWCQRCSHLQRQTEEDPTRAST